MMPLTPNGKIDKNKLPFPDTAKATQATKKGTPARNPIEAKLTDIWSNLLGFSFFSLFLPPFFILIRIIFVFVFFSVIL